MRFRTLAGGVALAACLMVGFAGLALARNPHCAGGIQYVVQADRDKKKGNLEDYQREIRKAVQQLEQCAGEDPVDFEAIGYLGWAYAEVDSACAAGKAFETAIKGLESKNDKKKAEWVIANRQSYWATAFNDGVAKIQAAQQAYPDFNKKAENDADKTLRDEAAKRYQEAITAMTRASCLRPGDSQTMRNLGSIYAFMGDYQKASAVFTEALGIHPSDSLLKQSLRSVQVNMGNQLLERKPEEAIAYFEQLSKEEPNNPEHQIALGSARFTQAGTLQGDAQKAEFRRAAESYEKAHTLKPSDADVIFNAALARQNATDWEKAVENWRATLKLRPNDPEASSALGAALAELKRYEEAIQVLHQAVLSKPEDKNLHRQLGAAYTKAGNNPKATEELMVYLALQNGTAEADPAGAAKKARDGSAAAKTLATEGAPDAVNKWEADNQKYETWFYWKKHVAFTIGADGSIMNRADWTVPVTKSAATSGKK